MWSPRARCTTTPRAGGAAHSGFSYRLWPRRLVDDYTSSRADCPRRGPAIRLCLRPTRLWDWWGPGRCAASYRQVRNSGCRNNPTRHYTPHPRHLLRPATRLRSPGDSQNRPTGPGYGSPQPIAGSKRPNQDVSREPSRGQARRKARREDLSVGVST